MARRSRQIRPAQVMQAVKKGLEGTPTGSADAYLPPWFRVVSSIPPAETIVRTIPTQHGAPAALGKATKPKNIYRPQRIVFIEDALRTTFYKDHPWELARPRIILESDGKDRQRCDWSRGVQQPGLALTGESVVQRQLWLMEVKNMSQNKAYDVARREFYKLRQSEEIERRIAQEEARYVGAYFGKTRSQVGMLLEDLEFENWKVWAGKENEEQAIRESTSASADVSLPVEDEFVEADAIELQPEPQPEA